MIEYLPSPQLEKRISEMIELTRSIRKDPRCTSHLDEECEELIDSLYTLCAHLGDQRWYHYFEDTLLEVADVHNLMEASSESWSYWFRGKVSDIGYVHWSLLQDIARGKSAMWLARMAA